jgi:hypothetical protein
MNRQVLFLDTPQITDLPAYVENEDNDEIKCSAFTQLARLLQLGGINMFLPVHFARPALTSHGFSQCNPDDLRSPDS